MSEVARAAGVSIKTVSNVLNDYRYLRPETRDRVLAAVEALGYTVNPSASSLRSGRTGAIAFAMPHLYQPYFAQMAERVIAEARALGLRVLIEPTDGRRDRELGVLAGVRRQLVDGVLYSPAALDAAELRDVHVALPLVLLGEPMIAAGVDHVAMPNEAGSYAVVEHLLATGRRRIAAVGVQPHDLVGAAALRLGGYRRAHIDAGVPVDEGLVVQATNWDLRASGAQAVVGLLRSGARFDAVFCFNDAMAVGALRALAHHGVRVPDDVALAGFDNTEETAFSVPSLTSVDPGQGEIARVAVQLLHRRMSAERAADVVDTTVVARHTLYVRESSAPGALGA